MPGGSYLCPQYKICDNHWTCCFSSLVIQVVYMGQFGRIVPRWFLLSRYGVEKYSPHHMTEYPYTHPGLIPMQALNMPSQDQPLPDPHNLDFVNQNKIVLFVYFIFTTSPPPTCSCSFSDCGKYKIITQSAGIKINTTTGLISIPF